MNDFNNFSKFTKEAKQALIVAQEKAKEVKLSYVGTEHILIGVLDQQNSLGASVLFNFGVSLDNVYLVLKTVGRASVPRKSVEPVPMDKAMEKFNAEKYRSAARLFEEILSSDSTNLKAMYYSALCYYELQNYKKTELYLTVNMGICFNTMVASHEA